MELQTWRKSIHPTQNRFTREPGDGLTGDTHTEDVQAHGPFHALLVGEVIFGELVNRCGENTHGWIVATLSPL